MSFLRIRASGILIWSMALATLWIGLPSTACRCANGGFKLFCDAHKQSVANEPDYHASTAKLDCCRHGKTVAQTDCCKRTGSPNGQLSSQGCTRISNSPVLAPVPSSSQIAPDHTIGLNAIPIDLSPAIVALATTQPNTVDTHPPVDLVIALHCFLI